MATGSTAMAHWYDMPAFPFAEIAPNGGGFQRHLRNRPSGYVPMIAGEGSWIVFSTPSLMVSLADITLDNDLTDHIVVGDYVLFEFALDGATSLNDLGGSSMQHNGFRCMVMISRGGRVVRQLTAPSGRVRRIGIFASIPALVEQYGFGVLTRADGHGLSLPVGRGNARMIDYPLMREQLVVIEAILDCRMMGLLRERFVESKISELLCYTLAHLCSPVDTLSIEREQCAIDAAAKLLEGNLRDTPSIQKLARQVGLNRNKIFAGFRERFGVTPGEYAREAKLLHARRLVTESELSMLEVADAVGFISQASFSRAYRSRFGASPRDDRRAAGIAHHLRSEQ